MENMIEIKELVSSNKMIAKSLKGKVNQSRKMFTKLSPDLFGQISFWCKNCTKISYNRSSVPSVIMNNFGKNIKI